MQLAALGTSRGVAVWSDHGILDGVLSRRRLLASTMALGGVPFLTGFTGASKVFGLGVDGLGAASIADAEGVAQKLNKRLDVINVYEAFAWQRPLPTGLLQSAGDTGAVLEITWEPWDPNGGVQQADYALAQITQGRYDAYISSWAADAARFGGRFLIRFCHEMNGNWYPWSVHVNGGSPQEYVAAFTHVHQLFADAGASNVDWVWSPNVMLNGNAEAIIDSYPGGGVVNIVGVDGYNFGDVDGHVWTPPDELFLPTLNLLSGIAPAKRLWINEVGCSEQGGDRFAWWSDLVIFLQGTSVSGLIPFEVDKDGHAWRMTDSQQDAASANAALAAW